MIMVCEKVEYLSKFYPVERLEHYKATNLTRFEELFVAMQPKRMPIVALSQCNNDWYVSSPDGLVPVERMVTKDSYPIYQVEFDDGTSVLGSELHMFENIFGGWVAIANLEPGQRIIAEGTSEKIVTAVVQTTRVEPVYDLVVKHDNHRYFTNGVSSHNSGAGKSVFLQNLAVNWAYAGLNVVYLSLELSEKLCSMRIDAMHTGYDTREVMRNIDDVHMRLKSAQRTHRGNIIVKQLPNGCTANDVRAYIKEVEIHKGVKVDAMLVDYLDLMMPTSKRISAENLFVKDKYVTEELRNLAVELNILCFTASQLNRGSHETAEFGHNHISGGISKINTADNVIGIFTSASMKDAGRYQIQFMKTRSSSGVGSSLDLAFDKKSLRITDLAEGEESASHMESAKLYEHLKNRSVIKSGPAQPPETSSATSKTTISAKDPLAGAAALRNLLRK